MSVHWMERFPRWPATFPSVNRSPSRHGSRFLGCALAGSLFSSVQISCPPAALRFHDDAMTRLPIPSEIDKSTTTYQPSFHLSSIPSSPASESLRVAGRPRTAPRPVDSSMMPRCLPRWERMRWSWWKKRSMGPKWKLLVERAGLFEEESVGQT